MSVSWPDRPRLPVLPTLFLRFPDGKEKTEDTMKSFPVILSAAIVLSLFAAQTIQGEERHMSELSITSPAFSHSGMIPKKYT